MNSHRPARVPWWVWPTILSLDAPAVAVVWQQQIAADVGVALGWPHRVVLGLSVWLAYVGDRWIEGWRLAPGQVRTRRHAFYQRHRWTVLALAVAGLSADLGIALAHLSPRELQMGALLTAAVLSYLLSHQLIHRDNPWRVPKEVVIAVLLGAGAGLFPLVSPGADTTRLVAPISLFALLAFANCALIASWEQHVDRSHGQTSLALQFSSGPDLGRAAIWLIVAGAALLYVAGDPSGRVTALVAASSALLLGAVDVLEPQLGPAAARVLSDVALLTPLATIVSGG